MPFPTLLSLKTDFDFDFDFDFDREDDDGISEYKEIILLI
jgi:hypothetical protein